MLGRLDQQMRVTRALVDAYTLPDDVSNPRLAKYMEGFLALIVTASSAFSLVRGDHEALRMRDEMWKHIYAKSPRMARNLKRHPLVLGSSVKKPPLKWAAVKTYRLAQHLYRFN